jgi:hypothetical protein
LQPDHGISAQWKQGVEVKPVSDERLGVVAPDKAIGKTDAPNS